MDHLHTTYFVGLSAAGFRCLWMELLANGAAQSIRDVVLRGQFPTGFPLRRTFTGIRLLDSHVLSPVIFYTGLLDSCRLPHRLLLTALFSTMQCTATCMQVMTLHSRLPRWLGVLENIAWGMVNQAWGAAVIYPLWCIRAWYQIRSSGQQDPATEVDEANVKAFVVASVFNGVAPLMLLYPAFFPCSHQTKQGFIAYYRVVPILSGLIRPVVRSLLSVDRTSKIDHGPPASSRKWLRAGFRVATVCSAASQLFVLTALLTSSTTVQEVFLPTGNEAMPFNIQQGAHRFLQFDWLIVAAALIPFAIMLRDQGRTHARATDSKVRNPSGMTSSIIGVAKYTLGGLLFSPGAILSNALMERL